MFDLDQPCMANHLNANSRKAAKGRNGDLFDGMYVCKSSTASKIQTKLCEEVGFSFRKC